MEVFKGNGKNNRKGLCTYDMKNEDDDLHLMLAMNEYGYLVAGVYHDNPDKLFNFEEYFTIDESNKQIFDLFNKHFLSYGGDVYFDAQGADLVLERDDLDNYVLHFIRNFEEKNNIVESRIRPFTMENESLYNLFYDLQKYDPAYHQIHINEYLTEQKKLNKTKKNIER